MKVSFHEVQIASPLYDAGRQDDGTPFVAECYHLQVTKPNGQRFDHRQVWPGAEVAHDDEGWVHFRDVRADSLRRALRLRRRVRRAGVIDMALWTEGRPVYGSPAYDGAADLELERMEG